MPEPDLDEAAWRDRLESFRQEKEAFLVDDPESPFAAVDDAPTSLTWFPLDPEYRVLARYQPVQESETVTLESTTGPARKYERVATFGVTIDGDHHVLTGYRYEGQDSIFVPFTDETNGDETPEIGRYLDVDAGDASIGDDVVLEFNLAQLPYAAYSDHYASTKPPENNHVDAAVRAGERYPD